MLRIITQALYTCLRLADRCFSSLIAWVLYGDALWTLQGYMGARPSPGNTPARYSCYESCPELGMGKCIGNQYFKKGVFFCNLALGK